MGKLMTTSASFDPSGKPMDRTKAMVMHRVALSTDNSNFNSANELGVLLADNGRWQQASQLFGQSLRIRQSATTWNNLAKAHQQMARLADNEDDHVTQVQLAQLAFGEANSLGGIPETMDAMVPADWTSPEDFSDMAAMPELRGEHGAITVQPTEIATQPTRERKGLFKNMKDWFLRLGGDRQPTIEPKEPEENIQEAIIRSTGIAI